MASFFKELFTLGKFLFADRPSDYNELKPYPMKYFPFKGYKYMMFCGKLIYREEDKDRIEHEMSTDGFMVYSNHETIHLKQAQVKRTWISYYITYVWEWIKGNPITKPIQSAYYTIPYEMEAYGNEQDMNYTLNYDGSNLKYYKIKDRKKTYKEHRLDWKDYCKSILKK